MASLEALLLTLAVSALSSFWTINVDGRSQAPEPAPYIYFDSESASWNGDYAADVSHTSEGILMLSCLSDVPLKLIVEKDGDNTYYAVPNDGSPFSIPLSGGSGIYMVSVMEHVQGISYRQAWKFPVECDLEDAFAPYRHPNIYVPYEEEDVCVQAAAALKASSMAVDLFLQSVEQFVEENVEYDHGYTATTLTDHVIDPDATLAEGKGICLDQAALVTAMCRSQGVPAKLVFGDTHINNGDPLYHAWTLAWNGYTWILLDACMPAEYQDTAVYEPSQWF